MTARRLIAEFEKLSPNEQLKVLAGIRELAEIPPPKGPGENIWDVMMAFAGKANANLPEDLAVNHDHYLYGTPKQQP